MAKRLNVFVARATGLSRRAADKVIFDGRVSIDGEIVIEPGRQVDTNNLVAYNGNPLALPNEPIWLLLNKPKGYITTRKDESGRRTVMDLLPEHLRGLFPVGRLDFDTEGVLLFTNDGETAHKMLHPGFEIERVYRAFLSTRIKPSDIDLARKGILLDGRSALPVNIICSNYGESRSVCEITLAEGRYHEVKRFFKALGYEVTSLERLSHAGISAEGLNRSEWRLLKKSEIEALKSRLEHKIDQRQNSK
jgi:23S rRNA pseudouridine2605 synthase